MSPWDALFDDLPDYLLEAALGACHDLSLNPDEVVMSAGDDDPVLVYVLDGEVAIRRDGVALDTSGPGEVIGESAVFRGVPRIADVVTREPTRVLIFSQASYDALVASNHPVAFRLERILLRQLAARLHRLDALVGSNSEGAPNPYAPPPKGFWTRVREALTNKVDSAPVIERELDAATVLDNSHLFRGERYTLIEGLAQYTEHYVWTAGQTLCEEGETGEALYLIAAGEADVYVRTQQDKVHKLGSVGPGAAVGMTSLVEGRPRTATVIATEQVDAFELPKANFDALVAQDGQLQSALRRAMIRAFAEQIDEAGANVVAVARAEANAKTEVYGG